MLYNKKIGNRKGERPSETQTSRPANFIDSGKTESPRHNFFESGRKNRAGYYYSELRDLRVKFSEIGNKKGRK